MPKCTASPEERLFPDPTKPDFSPLDVLACAFTMQAKVRRDELSGLVIMEPPSDEHAEFMPGWDVFASVFADQVEPIREALRRAQVWWREHRDLELATMPYPDYLKSPEWAVRRSRALTAAGHRCQLCNSPDHLHVHHRTYERRGREEPSDLTVLCAECHELFHKNGRVK